MDCDEVFVFSIKEEFIKDGLVVLFFIWNVLFLLKMFLFGWFGYLMFYVVGCKYYIYIDYFNLKSLIFSEKDYKDIVISDIVLVVWIGFFGYLVYVNFIFWLLKVYIIFYFIVNFWLVFIMDL